MRRAQANAVASITALPIREPESPGSLTAASRKALTEANVIDTWEAVAAIILAEALDRGKTGASGPAQVVAAHRTAMNHAMRNAGEEADVIAMIFAKD